MHWYEGSIVEAVSLSRKNGSIFVVYIEGDDEQSTRLTKIINEDDISKELSSSNFVSIKVQANTVPHQQFAEIYRGAKVPSVYFIGKTGAPLDIFENISDSAEFSQRVEVVLKKAGITTSKATAEAQQSSNLIAQERKEDVCENGVCTLKTTEPVASTSGSDDPKSSENEVPTVTTEAKVEKAKELIERTRTAKQKEEEEKERLKEMERRKMGQDVQKMKRWQQDQELKQLMEAREKEKKEQQEAKQRILDQIKQDKVDRAAKFSTTAQPTQSSPQSTSPAPVQRVFATGLTRIQFKLPDGSTHTHEFKSENTLEEIKAYIKTNLRLTYNFILATTFPRREFTDENNSNTLAELELVPSAVLLILPVSHGTVSTNGKSFTSFLWSLLAPILNILGYLKSMVFGPPKPSAEPTTSTDSNKRPADTTGDSSRPFHKKRAGETTVVKRQGNIHRLSDKNDSDDDTNTWNGNSTQQM